MAARAMQLRSALVAVCAALLGLAAQPAAASTSAGVNACKLLVAAVHHDPYWSLNLTKHTFTAAGGGAWRCELTSAPLRGSVSPAFVVVLTFFASPSAAVAHMNVASLHRKGPPLAGTGADEAFAQEAHAGGATSTRVTWRKGRYWGWLSVQGPRKVGDTEDARDLLKGFALRLSRT